MPAEAVEMTSVYYTTLHILNWSPQGGLLCLQKEASMCSHTDRCTLLPHPPHKSCTILPIFPGAAQKVFPKPWLLEVPACSLSFLLTSKALVCLTVALPSIMASYRMSFLSTRVLVESEAGLCPDIPTATNAGKEVLTAQSLHESLIRSSISIL